MCHGPGSPLRAAPRETLPIRQKRRHFNVRCVADAIPTKQNRMTTDFEFARNVGKPDTRKPG